MKSKLALEKNAESMLSISNNLGVAGCLAPFTYLLDIGALEVFEQWILRIAPIVIVVAALLLRFMAMHAFDRVSTLD